MTNKTPERSVEEIVEEFWEKESGTDIGYLHHKNDFIEAFTQILQAERKKREEMVEEAKREGFIQGHKIGREGVISHMIVEFGLPFQRITQTNNQK